MYDIFERHFCFCTIFIISIRSFPKYPLIVAIYLENNSIFIISYRSLVPLPKCVQFRWNVHIFAGFYGHNMMSDDSGHFGPWTII